MALHILDWSIPYSDNFETLDYFALGRWIMPLLNLNEYDYEVKDDYILVKPGRKQNSSDTNSIRLAVSDIKIQKDTEKRVLHLKLRITRLFVYPLFFAAFLLLGFSLFSIIFAIFGYVMAVAFLSLVCMIQLNQIKSRLEESIRSFG